MWAVFRVMLRNSGADGSLLSSMLLQQRVCDIVLVDVGDIGHGFWPDPLPGNDFNVGGTIAIPSTATGGIYSGDIEVTVDYQ